MSLSRIITALSICTLFILFENCSIPKYVQGQRLYDQYCSDCHMNDGSGVVNLYPSLLSNIVEPSSYPCIIRNGINSEKSIVEMLGFPDLTDVEINNIVNYIVNDLNSTEMHLLINDTRKLLENCNQK